MTTTSRSEWIADLRRRHRPETLLTLLQLQELGPGLYSSTDLVGLLGIQTSSINLSLARLKCSGLIRYEGWLKKGRLVWWVANWDAQEFDHQAMFPRWVLQANAVRTMEVLLGKERETARKLGVNYKSFSNFLGGGYGSARLLGEWSVKLNPIQFVQHGHHF